MEQDKIWDHFQNTAPASFDQAAPRLNFLAGKAFAAAGKRGKVLNIGVGSGIFEAAALKLGLDCYSIDPNKTTIESLRHKLSRSGDNFKTGLIQAIPFTDGFFDAVVVSEIIEHLNKAETDAGLKEISRVLKPAGWILGTVPADENLEESVTVCPDCGRKFHRFGHEQSFTEKRVLEILERRRFEIKTIRTRPFISVKTFKWLGKTMTLLKLARFLAGLPSYGDSIYFAAVKR